VKWFLAITSALVLVFVAAFAYEQASTQPPDMTKRVQDFFKGEAPQVEKCIKTGSTWTTARDVVWHCPVFERGVTLQGYFAYDTETPRPPILWILCRRNGA
jgi:hypothetical protein